MQQSMTDGAWVLLQNCHLGLDYMDELLDVVSGRSLRSRWSVVSGDWLQWSVVTVSSGQWTLYVLSGLWSVVSGHWLQWSVVTLSSGRWHSMF